ncbi:unnamed protein product [Clonostachys byssicola]|uniref:Zn(2)-C6 fungal-type domain-containing protein n=1 Tax=Clonostachys byssicola TaxID=160290 RepID=A0A9N9UT04_9HYPO|nr:unnamed protein product [Clonostachys byssicola]
MKETRDSDSPRDSDEPGEVEVGQIKRRPRPCKGHTKSRRGCFNCKRRRVKCPETLPRCNNCVRLGLNCTYPPEGGLVPASRPSHTSSPMTMPLSSSPTRFTIEDLRFFHHFLFAAYPPLPIGGKEIWRDMAALSHGFDYLVHAVLGLAASHLTLASRNEIDYSAHALSHRVQAINSLNTALSKPCASMAEGDARFATLMALTFQSSYMPDGMVDFLAMIRGCTVVPGTGMPSFSESVFQGFSAEAHQQSIIEMNEDRPEAKDQRLASFAIDGLKSLYALRPFCPDGSLEGTYLDALEGVLELTIKCPLEAFTSLCSMYNIFNGVDHDNFTSFIDPSSTVPQILLAHFFLIETKIGLLTLQAIIESFPFRGLIVASWVHNVARGLPREFHRYMDWPLSEAASIDVWMTPNMLGSSMIAPP